MPDITMPRLSDSMVDGTIVSWLRADGDEISIGDEICEVETDKAVMPYQAEYAGTLKIVVREGEAASVGTLIAYIGEPDASNQPEATASATAAAPAVAQSASVAARAFSLNGAGSGRVNASPIARRLAASCGVDLALLTGSGPGGRIVKRDIERAGDELVEQAERRGRRSARWSASRSHQLRQPSRDGWSRPNSQRPTSPSQSRSTWRTLSHSAHR